MGELTFIKTRGPEFDEFLPKTRFFLRKSALDILVDGKKIRGYRTPDTKSFWIRDYSDMLRGIEYIESDIKSLIEHFAETQALSGRIFDYFTTFPEKKPCEKENWTKYVRVPVEADVDEAEVQAGYKSSGASFSYAFCRSGGQISIEVHSPQSEVLFHVLLPEDLRAKSVIVNGKEHKFQNK